MKAVNKICLVVDDDPDDHEIFTKALSDVSPEVICYSAFDGLEALSMLTEAKIFPDFIFLDINMPRMNGCEFLMKIKTIEPLKNIPVIVRSTNPLPQQIAELNQLGASEVHVKQHSYAGLRNMLTRYFQSDTTLLN